MDVRGHDGERAWGKGKVDCCGGERAAEGREGVGQLRHCNHRAGERAGRGKGGGEGERGLEKGIGDCCGGERAGRGSSDTATIVRVRGQEGAAEGGMQTGSMTAVGL